MVTCKWSWNYIFWNCHCLYWSHLLRINSPWHAKTFQSFCFFFVFWIVFGCRGPFLPSAFAGIALHSKEHVGTLYYHAPFSTAYLSYFTNIIEVVFMNPWLWSWSYNCIFREMLRDDYLTCGFSLLSIFQQIFLSVPVMLVCLLVWHHFGIWAALEAMIIRFSL
jgi:hypothetical protein